MRKKAVALLSGGLDSILAIKMVKDQGIEVIGFHILLPFVRKTSEKPEAAADWLGVRLVRERVEDDYVDVLRRPRYGYGKGFNPCIDCRIYMLGSARRLMDREGASFLLTGDVLQQRPKSQTPKALRIQDRASGLDGLILRPLSALVLAPTIPEREGLVDRSEFLGLRGRSRRTQLEMAERFGLQSYGTPAGGCPLTCKEFGVKARALVQHVPHLTIDDLALLTIGRHFYRDSSHIIVGRNQAENRMLQSARSVTDTVLQATAYGGPVTLIRGDVRWGVLVAAARLAAAYSRAPSDADVEVEYSTPTGAGTLTVEQTAGHD